MERGGAIETLRTAIERVEGRGARAKRVLLFGVQDIDDRLPGGGLAMGAVHEVAGDGNGVIDGAAAALFSAGVADPVRGPRHLRHDPKGRHARHLPD